MPPADTSTTWQQQAHEYLVQGRYDRAAALYEQAIEAEPKISSYYWHYGLLLLLQGEEAEAQTTWLLALSEVDPEQIEQSNAELISVLQTEAERRESFCDYSMAWAIRQHIREIASDYIDNLLQLVRLSIEIELFTPDIFEEIGLIYQIQVEHSTFDPALALDVIKVVLSQLLPSPEILNLIEVCRKRISSPKAWHDVLIPAAFKLGYDLQKPKEAAALIEAVLQIC